MRRIILTVREDNYEVEMELHDIPEEKEDAVKALFKNLVKDLEKELEA